MLLMVFLERENRKFRRKRREDDGDQSLFLELRGFFIPGFSIPVFFRYYVYYVL